MLELLDILKAYRGGVRGVDGVTLRLGPGLVDLLGPDGAGKSSLMRIAATVPARPAAACCSTARMSRPGRACYAVTWATCRRTSACTHT